MPVCKNINKDFFKKWTASSAYVSGFFAADGYITVNKRGGQFWSIHINDKELLEGIKKAVESEHTIGVRFKKGSSTKSYRLQIGSAEMCDDLRKLGFFERKTKSLVVPNVPSKYFSHFVRGYFDGDGHVWTGYVNKGRMVKSWTIQTGFTSASLEFLKVLRDRLETMGVARGVLRKGRGEYYRLNYSVKGSLNLRNFMYNHKDSTETDLFLDRKKSVFDRFIKTRGRSSAG